MESCPRMFPAASARRAELTLGGGGEGGRGAGGGGRSRSGGAGGAVGGESSKVIADDIGWGGNEGIGGGEPGKVPSAKSQL